MTMPTQRTVCNPHATSLHGESLKLLTFVSFVIPMHTSTKAETLVKIGSAVVEIFGEIGCFLPYRFKSTNFSHLSLWRYWTKVHHICTR